MSRVLSSKCFCAPITRLEYVLDIGTGTGRWPMEVGDGHPESHIIGIDVTPMQSIWTSPNVQYQIFDIEQDWTFRESFDFIFCRQLAGCVKDWGKLINQSHEKGTLLPN